MHINNHLAEVETDARTVDVHTVGVGSLIETVEDMLQAVGIEPYPIIDDLKLHLITNEEEEKIPDLIDRLDEIKDDLISYGIDFDYQFRDFHDRCIKTDTGWTITLGRGLDIFEKYSPYSIEAMRQDKRKCKEFMVTYMKTNKA
jgi:hypothetical protein